MSVTIKSYRVEREKEIISNTISNLDKVGELVVKQAKDNVRRTPPNHPQVQTGNLMSSIIHVSTPDQTTPYVEIGSTINNPPYPTYLELGTAKMPPYPWLLPAVEMQRENITKILGSKYSVTMNNPGG